MITCLLAVLLAQDLHVSPGGNDAGDGTAERPFATLARARDAARASEKPVRILLRGGTHVLSEPLVLTALDRGTWAAYPGERPVISGGRRITGWTAGPDGVWFAGTRADFRQLLIDGRRATRARSPNEGFYRVQGNVTLGPPVTFTYARGDLLPAWADRGDVEVVLLQAWAEARLPIRSMGASPETPEGRRGKALRSGPSHVEVPHAASLEPAQLTVEAWVRLSAFPKDAQDARRWIVSKGSNEWTEGHYSLVVSGKDVGAYLNVGGGRENCFAAFSETGPLTLDRWHRLALTYDGTTLSTWLDGARMASVEVKKPRVPGAGALEIGRRPDGYRLFDGLVDEVRVYDRVLSEAELKGDDAPGAVGAWNFEEDAKDSSGRGNHGRRAAGTRVTLGGKGQPYNREANARYWIENAPEALDAPGEWYLDRKAGRVAYRPRPGEDPSKAEFIAPALTQLVRLEGARGLRFEGLTFAHADWSLPPDGYADIQAAFDIPAAFSALGARSVVLEDCRFEHLGAWAVEFGRGCTDNVVSRCEMTGLGAGGIKLGEAAIREKEEDRAGRNQVVDCRIHDIGIVYPAAIGVWVGQSAGNRVAHNHIHHTNYSAISCGWTWGYGKSLARDNVFEFNHLHDIGRDMLSDMGAIYTLGIQPGTVIRNNLIHDVSSFTYGGWGIYPDEGSSEILIENNVVYRTKSGGFHQHYGRDNVVRNNVFALAREAQIIRSRLEPHRSFTFERNIVYWKDGPLIGGGYSDKPREGYAFDRNLYFRVGGGPIPMARGTFDEWKKAGQDAHSILADPLFVDPDGGDFRLREGSPASKIGFVPIDLGAVGPRRR